MLTIELACLILREAVAAVELADLAADQLDALLKLAAVAIAILVIAVAVLAGVAILRLRKPLRGGGGSGRNGGRKGRGGDQKLLHDWLSFQAVMSLSRLSGLIGG